MSNYNILGLLFVHCCLESPILGSEIFSQGLFYLSPISRELAKSNSDDNNEKDLKYIDYFIRNPTASIPNLEMKEKEKEKEKLPTLETMLSDKAWPCYFGMFYASSKNLIDGHLYSGLSSPEIRLFKKIASKVLAGYPDLEVWETKTTKESSLLNSTSFISNAEFDEIQFWKENEIKKEAADWFVEWVKEPIQFLIDENGFIVNTLHKNSNSTSNSNLSCQRLKDSLLWRNLNSSCFLKQSSSKLLSWSLLQKIKINKLISSSSSQSQKKEEQQEQDFGATWPRGAMPTAISSVSEKSGHWVKVESANDYYSYGTAYIITILVFTGILILFLVAAMFLSATRVYKKYTTTVQSSDVQVFTRENGKNEIQITNPQLSKSFPSGTVLYRIS
jgi:hypothetical protein